jgi:hypothetical protein
MRTTFALAVASALSATLGVAACGGKGASEPTGGTLAVTSVEPTSAAPASGVPIVIHGSGFMAESRAIQVYIGDAPANVLSVDSDSDLQVEVPAGEAGKTVDIKVVFDPGGEIRLAHAFTFAAASATTPAP